MPPPECPSPLAVPDASRYVGWYGVDKNGRKLLSNQVWKEYVSGKPLLAFRVFDKVSRLATPFLLSLEDAGLL